jgi:hypothetical protein
MTDSKFPVSSQPAQVAFRYVRRQSREKLTPCN